MSGLFNAGTAFVERKRSRGALKLDNRTDWSTRDLRAFVLAGLRAEGVADKHWTVTVGNARQSRGCSGYAYFHRERMTLRLPSVRLLGNPDAVPPSLLADFAHVLVHEVAHTRGVGHRELRGGWNGLCHGGERNEPPPAWAEGRAIRRQAEPVKKPRAQANEAKARDALATWTRKLKLAQTKVRRYRTSVKRYDRIAACAAVQAAAP